MEHPFTSFIKVICYDKEAAVKLVAFHAPFITINTVMPAVDIVIKMLVALFTIIGVLHTMYTNQKRLENELKNKENGKRKSE